MDPVLLGVVDYVGAVRRFVHCPHIQGRTIKEFILGTLLLPSGFSFLWFSVFGATGLHLEMFEGINLAQAVQQDITSALFVTLDALPAGYVLGVLATLLIVMFFITSADSATFVLGMMSSDGNPNPSIPIKLTWGIFQSLIAIVLLLSGGLNALQTASILTALPFAVVLLGMCASLAKALRREEYDRRLKEKKRRRKLDELLQER